MLITFIYVSLSLSIFGSYTTHKVLNFWLNAIQHKYIGHWTYDLTEAATGCVLKNFSNSQENTSTTVSFSIKLQALAASLLKNKF